MTNTPLPCPCCGRGASISVGVESYIFCCGCQLQTKAYRTKEEALAAWNRRAAQLSTEQTVICWLGSVRNKFPDECVSAIQNLLIKEPDK